MVTIVIHWQSIGDQCLQWLFYGDNGDTLAQMAWLATVVPMDHQWCHENNKYDGGDGDYGNYGDYGDNGSIPCSKP